MLIELFEEIEVEKYISAPKPYGIYKFSGFNKMINRVGESLIGYNSAKSLMVQNVGNQEVGALGLLKGLSKKTWLSQSESSYFDQIPLFDSEQNNFGFHLFADKEIDVELSKISFQRNSSDCYFLWNSGEAEATHHFQKLTPKAIVYFRKFYKKQLSIPKYLRGKTLLAELKELFRFSKQLPVLEKLSVRLFEKLGKESNLILLSDSKDVLLGINAYMEKIKQLAKGANERKTTFAIMQKHLLNMKLEIEKQVANEKQLSEKLELIQEEAILFYVYAVLQNPILHKKYSRIYQEYLPRVALFHDFWTWSELGRELVESLQLLNPTKKEFGNWEDKGVDELELIKLTFDIRRRKLLSDGKVVLNDIPEAVFLPKLGKTPLVKYLLKLQKSALLKSEVNKIMELCLNYWQVLEKIQIFSEHSTPFYFNYNEQIS
jgi:hypothetical protein